MRWSRLTELLAAHGQMIPLDPPLANDATVGGVLGANSWARRRLYGTARDQVIGMEFAMLEGKLVQSGGMVVKNVAGLDMAKLMIGAFGTLAIITRANFKLTPVPETSAIWVIRCPDADAAVSTASQLRKTVLQPAMLDVVNPVGADRLGLRGWSVLVQAGGVPSALARYDRELPAGTVRLDKADADALFSAVREFVPAFLREFSGGGVLKISTGLTAVGEALRRYPEAASICRAGSGITYVCAEDVRALRPAADSVIEAAPPDYDGVRWQLPSAESPAANSVGVMRELKALFDPKALLNPGRLYGRL